MSSKSVLITGCSDLGIGSGLAKEYASRGWQVFATARKVEKMKDLAALPNVTLFELDVVKIDTVRRAAVQVRKATGGSGLDVLISNAGRNHFMPLLDITLEEGRELFETNVWGPFSVVQEFSPMIIQKRGKLVFITTVVGHISVPYMGTYAASKRSLEIMAEHLRVELAPLGVSVLSVVTAGVKTMGQSYFGDWKLPKGSLFSAAEEINYKRANGIDSYPRMPLAQYSYKVVEKINRGATARYWCGPIVWMFWLMAYLLPQWVTDKLLTQGSGQDLIKLK